MADAASTAESTEKKGPKKTPEGSKKKNKGKKSPSTGDGQPGSSSNPVPALVTDTPHKEKGAAVTSGAAAVSQVTTKEGKGDTSQGKEEKSQKTQAKQNKGAPPKQDGTKTPESGGGEQKSKAQLKAERRAIQEAQRAAKEAKKAEGAASAAGGGAVSHSASSSGSTAAAAAGKKETVSKKDIAVDVSKPASASSHEKGSTDKKLKKKTAAIDMSNLSENEYWALKEQDIVRKYAKIDNSILNLGFQYFHHKIVGGNARCVALLTTLKEIIAKYRTPEEKELSRDLEKNFLTPFITYLNYCRPISTSMGNAIKHLKYHINQIPRGMDDETAIERLQDVIDNFINDNIFKASEAVAIYADSKIDNDDVILVYAASSLICQVLKRAHSNGKKFRVIVVEGRPRTEGKSMLRCLVRCGIPCSYVYIGSASHAMSEATKVFLGASAMFAIGDMLSRTGNSMIAALAKANNIPVLVCSETYKFTEKVQLHSVDSNLHARGTDLITFGHKEPIIPNHEEIGLRLLNLMYDVTQSRYITALVTELGMLPCTSVPVVLRRQEDLASEAVA